MNETKKLDLKKVISGEDKSISYLILLPGSPDGFYHFNVSSYVNYIHIRTKYVKA